MYKKVTFLHWKETMKLASNALIVKPALSPAMIACGQP